MVDPSTSSPRVLAVLGSSGFVGAAVARAARAAGHDVRSVTAPRLVTSARDVAGLEAELTSRESEVLALASALQGADAVVNAAGIADASADDSAALFGANALLPVVARAACARAGVDTLTHVSSAAVQGRTRRLSESRAVAPFSPYSASKALAEQALLTAGNAPRVVIYRATSVQGRDRPVTRRLAALASSRWSSVARPGGRPTPQVLVENLADGIVFATGRDDAPALILHPHEGMTTDALLEVLGARRPHQVPAALARTVLAGGYAVGRRLPRAASTARRLEMLWFGQEQDAGWLERAGWTPPLGRSAWSELREPSSV